MKNKGSLRFKRISSTNSKTLFTNSPSEAALIIKKGGLVIFPTETVFGLGASSLNQQACERIYRVKNRPIDNPLIAHFSDIESIDLYADLNPIAIKLLEKFAPGPLTLILRKKNPNLFTTGLNTVAVRIPSYPIAHQLLVESGIPISAPSANPSGKPSFTRNQDVVDYFSGRVDCILLEADKLNAETKIGIESTVLDVSSDIPKILRPGSIEVSEIQEVLGIQVEIPEQPEAISPGVKYKHYAPNANVHLFYSVGEILEILEKKSKIADPKYPKPKLAILSYADTPLSSLEEWMLSKDDNYNRNIKKKSFESNIDYAKDLYAFFLDCDREDISEIFCECPREGRLFPAILNRLKKAIQ